MARSFSAPEQLYEPGIYGPFSVDGLTNANTTALEWRATVVDWPDDPALRLFVLTVKWDDGTFARFFVNGGRKNPDGTPATEVKGRISVPMENDGTGAARKGQVASGSISAEVFVPVRTALSLSAV